MTVSSQYQPHSYKPGAAMAPEGIPFEFLDLSDIKVTHIDAATSLRTLAQSGSDYVISGDGSISAGAVTATRIFPTDDIFVVERATDTVQPVPIPVRQPMPSKDYERQLDRMAFVAQERQADVDDISGRALMVPHGETAGTLAPVAERANKWAVFDPLTGLKPVALNPGLGGDKPVIIAARAILAALIDPASDQAAVLTEPGRAGTFKWRTGDYSAQVAIDTVQGVYVAPSSDPTGASGAWERVFEGALRAEWFGVDTAAADNAASVNAAYGLKLGPVFFNSGTYSFLKPVTLPSGAVVAGGDIVWNFLLADVANFPTAKCVTIGDRVKTAMAALSADIAEGARVFNFAAPHGRQQGDTFQLFNRTDYSQNWARPEYHAGEMFRVAQRVSDTQLVVTSAARDTYPAAAIDVYARPGGGFTQLASKFRVQCPDTIFWAIYFGTLDKLSYNNLEATGGQTAIEFSDCYEGYGANVLAIQTANAVNGYGVALANSQGISGIGNFFGQFNGMTTGGNADAGRVPPRDCHWQGKFASDPTVGLAGGNFHGNTEFCSYAGDFINGVVIAGDHNEVTGRFVGRNGRPAIVFGELHGLSFKVSGDIITQGADLPTTNGAIDLGVNSVAYGAGARRGGKLIFDISIDAPNATRIIGVRPRGVTVGDPKIIEFRRLDLKRMHATTRILIFSKNSGGLSWDRIQFGSLTVQDNAVPLTWSPDVDTKISGFSKVVPVTVNGTGSTLTASFALPFSFPRTPSFTPVITTPPFAGSSLLIQSITGASASGGTVNLKTLDNASQTIAATVNVTARIDD